MVLEDKPDMPCAMQNVPKSTARFMYHFAFMMEPMAGAGMSTRGNYYEDHARCEPWHKSQSSRDMRYAAAWLRTNKFPLLDFLVFQADSWYTRHTLATVGRCTV